MEIVLEYHDITSSKRLERLVKESLKSLKQKFPFIGRADVFFKKDNRSDQQGKICEVRLSMPGPRLNAVSNAETFESAFGATLRSLKVQLLRKKGRLNPHM